MLGLASFIMAGRWQAVLVTLGAAIAALLLPFFALLSGAAVALVSLRRGLNDGLWITAIASVLVSALGFFMQQPFAGLAIGLAQWLPMVGFALLLRNTNSWAFTLQVMTGIALIAVVGVNFWLGDPQAYWFGMISEVFEPVFEQSQTGLSSEELQEGMQKTASVMTGLFAASLLISFALSLLLGRSWQAGLYNEGGFRKEFFALRLGKPVSGAALLLLGLAGFLDNSLLLELAIVVLTVLLIQGFALVHGVNHHLNLHFGWLIGFYVLLFIALPQVLAMVAAFGLLDNFIDFRGRLQKAKPSSDDDS